MRQCVCWYQYKGKNLKNRSRNEQHHMIMYRKIIRNTKRPDSVDKNTCVFTLPAPAGMPPKPLNVGRVNFNTKVLVFIIQSILEYMIYYFVPNYIKSLLHTQLISRLSRRLILSHRQPRLISAYTRLEIQSMHDTSSSEIIMISHN